jgi:molybdopterin synthase sulfur carrier subunit
MVTLLFFGLTLRESIGESQIQLDVGGPITVKQLIETHQDRLGALVPLLTKSELLVTINRKVGTLESTVRDGDTVKLTHQFNPTYEGATWQNP